MATHERRVEHGLSRADFLKAAGIITGSAFLTGLGFEAQQKFKHLKAFANLGAPPVPKGVSAEGTVAAPAAPATKPATAPTKKSELTKPPEELVRQEAQTFAALLGLREGDVAPDVVTKTDVSGQEFGIMIDTKTETPFLVTDSRGTWMPAYFKELGQHGGLSAGMIVEDPTRKLRKLLGPEFNKGTIPYGWRWSQPEPPPAPFTFGDVIVDADAAKSLGIRDLRLTAVLSGRGDPNGDPPLWIRAKLRTGISRGELTDYMTNVVRVTMEHLKNHKDFYPSPIEVVVVNEPLTPDDPFVRILGPEYVDQMYLVARETYPEAKLMYDIPWAFYSKGSYTKTGRETAQRLSSKGLIDVVGFQLSFDITNMDVSAEDITKTMLSFGVQPAISRFLVDTSNLHGSLTKRFAKQAEVAERGLSAALKAGVKDIGFWDVIDYDQTQNEVWDKNYNRKPFYYAVRRAILHAVTI